MGFCILYLGTSAEWDRIYDVRRDAYGNTICGCSINRIGYRNSEIVKEMIDSVKYTTYSFVWECEFRSFVD